MRKLFLGFILLSLTSCEVYSVINDDQIFRVTDNVREHQYRVHYDYEGNDFFMEIQTEEPLKVGDKLKLKIEKVDDAK